MVVKKNDMLERLKKIQITKERLTLIRDQSDLYRKAENECKYKIVFYKQKSIEFNETLQKMNEMLGKFEIELIKVLLHANIIHYYSLLDGRKAARLSSEKRETKRKEPHH